MKLKKIASYFGKFKIEGVEVEVIGEPQMKTINGGWMQPFVPKRKQIRNLEGMRIPLILLEDQLKAYERLGRKNKVQKIKRVTKKTTPITYL